MRARPAFLAMASSLLFAAVSCTGDSPDPKTPAEPERAAPENSHHRLALTKALIDDNKLTPQDLTQLQLYLHGRVILRRETTVGAREITKQHTLRVVDGRSYDELLIDSGTPGVSLGGEGLRVNFDPEDAQNGLTFDEGEGRYRLTIERKPGDPSIGVRYGADRYELVDGASSYLEVEEEKLHDYVTHQRKLPGTVLPP